MLIFIALLLVLLIMVIWFEFKYMRPKRREEIEAVLNRDEAYNALMSAKAVSRSLKDMGKDTREAEVLLERAQMSYDQRDYAKTISVAKATKEVLIKAKDMPIPERPRSPDAPAEMKERPPEEHSVHEVKKLPQNYLESKFMMTTARAEIDKASADGRDVVEAEKLMREAQASFDAADYTECLKTSLKAKRSIGASPAKDAPPSPEAKAEMKAPPAVPGPERCRQCGADLVEGDNFCGKCGAKAEREARCASCGNILGEDDVFCRKCGARRA
ncbi:MAG: zinc ribbon domain-containing protein [Methanomassiliicoccales archaeon]|nr:MAG: zinc ribbon domain-containing protein [Methanomassiliicoccales archaeon]